MVWSQFRLSNIRRLPQQHTGTSGHRSRGCDITVPPNLNKEMNQTSAKSALTNRLWNQTGIRKYHSCLFLPGIWRRMHIFLSMEKNGLIIKLQVVHSERKLLKAGSIQGVCRDVPRADRDWNPSTSCFLWALSQYLSIMNIHEHSTGAFKVTAFFFTKMRWVYTPARGSATCNVGSSLMNSPLQLISFPTYPLESQKVSHENSSKLSECMECNLRLVIHPA